MSKSRIEGISDGVIAIVITILVLNLRVPKTPSIMEIWNIRIHLLAYISSFIFVAVIWQTHHQLLSLAEKVGNSTFFANIFWLFWLTLCPFVTQWIGEFPYEIWPAFSYTVVYFMWSLSYGILSKNLVRVNGEDSVIARYLEKDIRSRISLAVNLVVFIGIFFYPPIAIIGRFLISALWIKSYKL